MFDGEIVKKIPFQKKIWTLKIFGPRQSPRQGPRQSWTQKIFTNIFSFLFCKKP